LRRVDAFLADQVSGNPVGSALLVEEKLGSRATYREKNSISQNVSET
jgi:hypothetical protein